MFYLTGMNFVDRDGRFARSVGAQLALNTFWCSNAVEFDAFRESCASPYGSEATVAWFWRNGYFPIGDTARGESHAGLDCDRVYLSSEYIELRRRAQSKAGVYFLYSCEELVYIGRGSDLNFRAMHSVEEKLRLCDVTHIEYIITGSRTDAFIIEDIEIARYRPRLNINGKYDDPSRVVVSHPYERSARVPIWNAKAPGLVGGQISDTTALDLKEVI
ncbi:hypothetical protein [Rhodococcus sp. HS-D2]|uniref:hypothetical protein n=1 Tax=Rhodococcus sp. HS-D2 TaxID=1384636 RepID=UPI000AA5FEE7|nr:hypothetical protein [Rhodococcus sp. HS-D2]